LRWDPEHLFNAPPISHQGLIKEKAIALAAPSPRCGAVARPAKVERHNHKRERALKSTNILVIKIDLLIVTKSERFVEMQ